MDNFKGTSGSFLSNKILLRYSYFMRNNNKKYVFSNILKVYILYINYSKYKGLCKEYVYKKFNFI